MRIFNKAKNYLAKLRNTGVPEGKQTTSYPSEELTEEATSKVKENIADKSELSSNSIEAHGSPMMLEGDKHEASSESEFTKEELMPGDTIGAPITSDQPTNDFVQEVFGDDQAVYSKSFQDVSIIELVNSSVGVSSRLLTVINRPKYLPHESVGDYLKDKHARSKYLSLPGMGQRTLSELIDVLNDKACDSGYLFSDGDKHVSSRFADSPQEEEQHDHESSIYTNASQLDNESQDKLSHNLFDLVMGNLESSQRLENVFSVNKQNIPHDTLKDFVEDKGAYLKYKNFPNMGKGTYDLLNKIVQRYVGKEGVSGVILAQEKSKYRLDSFATIEGFIETTLPIYLNERELSVLHDRFGTKKPWRRLEMR